MAELLKGAIFNNTGWIYYPAEISYLQNNDDEKFKSIYVIGWNKNHKINLQY